MIDRFATIYLDHEMEGCLIINYQETVLKNKLQIFYILNSSWYEVYCSHTTC